jgi:hypothetical protein
MNPRAVRTQKYRKDADWIDHAVEEPTRPMRGIKTVFEALMEEDFPMDRAGINYCVGDIEIEDGKGGFIPVHKLTDRFPTGTKETFESPHEAIRALRSALKLEEHDQ